jgi:glucose dehydrogenase
VRKFALAASLAGLLALTVLGLASAAPSGIHSAKAVSVSSAADNAYLPKGVQPCTNNWLMFGCDTTGTGYSQLSQITPANVANLKLDWSNGYSGNTFNVAVESQPICCVNNLMFSIDGTGAVAIDPATGTTQWQYQGPTSRTFTDGSAPRVLNARMARSQAYDPALDYMYVGQQDGSIAAVNMKTGAPVWQAAVEGTGTYGSQTSLESQPFTVFCGYSQCGSDGLVFSGPNNGDSPIRGHIDAYDAKTGKLIWRSYYTPDPSQSPAILSWGDPAEAALGGAAAWSLPTEDPATGMIYEGTGNPYPYLGRSPGEDLWADSMMAVNMGTGALNWYFQDVHHDEWDYDCPNSPVEYNAMIGGKLTAVVSHACKDSYVFQFNPANGRAINPITQVQMSTLPGYTQAGATLNTAWPSQPEATGGSAQMIDHCPSADRANASLPGDYPTGPDGTPTVLSCDYVAPNATNWLFKPYYTSNGINYPRASFDPKLDLQFFCATTSVMIEKNQGQSNKTTIINSGRVSLLGESGTVSALNMSNNTLAWQTKLQANQDGNCYSGTMTTASGLLFYATKGRTDGDNPTFMKQGINPGGILYAVDAATGKVLWKQQNPYGDLIEAPPITYMFGGKQYVAEYFECPLATNGPFPGCSSHDRLMVYSL